MTKPKFKVGDKVVQEYGGDTFYGTVAYTKMTKNVWTGNISVQYCIVGSNVWRNEKYFRHPTQEEINLYYNK